MDLQIMFHFKINPHTLTEEQWIKAYVGVKKIIAENKKK